MGTVVCLALERDAYADLTLPKQVVVLLRRGILGRCCGHNLMLSCLELSASEGVHLVGMSSWSMEFARP
jgi:hypothetical protein